MTKFWPVMDQANNIVQNTLHFHNTRTKTYVVTSHLQHDKIQAPHTSLFWKYLFPT
jgi:hypothetical protein